MNTQGHPTFRILKDLNSIVRARVYRAVQIPRMIRTDGDQAQIKRSSQVSDLCELRVSRKLVEAGAEFFDPFGYTTVAGVAGEPYGLGT